MVLHASPSPPQAQLIALLKTLAPFEHWLDPQLPEDLGRWVARADRQELMSMVVAGLWRLMCTPDPDASADPPAPSPPTP